MSTNFHIDTGNPITLWCTPHSLYSGKVRSYLIKKGLPYRELLPANPHFQENVVPAVGHFVVPIVETTDGQLIQDSTVIIEELEHRFPERPMIPTTPVQRVVATLLGGFGSEGLLPTAMHYRWSVLDQQHDFIMSEFGKLSDPTASYEEQIALGAKTSRAFSGMVPALGITAETIPGIEAAYLALLDQLDSHFSRFDFLLGSRPSIGDYGLIGPLYAHLGRDPVPKALMEACAPHVAAWVARMNNPQPLAGEYLADDVIPETLLPVLATVCRDQFPDVLDAIEQNSQWLDANPGGSIPRFLGMHRFTFGAATGERIVSSYAQWLFQRAWRHYQSLAGADRAAADALLENVGGLAAMNVELRHWVQRRPGQLELVTAERPPSGG